MYSRRALTDGLFCGIISTASRVECRVSVTYLVYVKVQDGEDGVRVAFLPVALHRRAHLRLRQDEIRQIVELQLFGIPLEQLRREPFYCEVIHVRVEVKEVKVDID